MLEFLTNFFKVAAALVNAGKWPIVLAALMVAISVYGKMYVDDKHLQGMGEFRRVDRKIAEVENTSTRMVSAIRSVNKSLKDLNDNLKDVKDTVKTVDQTNRDTQKMVIDIYKNQAGG